jgi:hypothetical protein
VSLSGSLVSLCHLISRRPFRYFKSCFSVLPAAEEGKKKENISFFPSFSVLGFELRAYTLSHSTSPFFVMGFFQIGSCELFAQGRLQTMILLNSAS